MTERIVVDKKYRICSDAANDVWDKLSFWTVASDVELDDGTTLQDFIDNGGFVTDYVVVLTVHPETLYNKTVTVTNSSGTVVSTRQINSSGNAVIFLSGPGTYTFSITY